MRATPPRPSSRRHARRTGARSSSSDATSFFAVPRPKRRPPRDEEPVPEPDPPVEAEAPQHPSGPPLAPVVVITPAPPPAELSPDGSNAVRVFAIVLGLFAMASTALMLTMLAVALSVGGTRDAPVVTAKPPPMKAKKDRYRDTGRVEPIREKKTTRKTTKTSKKKAVPDKAKTSKKKATTAPGMLVLHVPADSGFRGVEVNCPGGYRERASFTDGKATLSGVPAADCSAHFKGPFPVKAKVSGGMSRSCTFVGTTARCVPK